MNTESVMVAQGGREPLSHEGRLRELEDICAATRMELRALQVQLEMLVEGRIQPLESKVGITPDSRVGPAERNGMPTPGPGKGRAPVG